ncbi:MAG: peptidoglycan DD-metalloendopeptidase family protein [bacterium]|nr:peptidoglycan DD-metalloendopeptidase family protein [bacterium]
MKALLIFVLLAETADIETSRQQLERLKKEFQETKRKIAQMETKMKSAEEELERITKKENEIMSFIEKLNRDIASIQNEIAKLEVQIKQKEEELYERADRIKFSLNLLYQTPPENQILKFLPSEEEEKEVFYLIDYVIKSEKRERDRAVQIYNELKAYRDLRNENLEFVKAMKEEVVDQKKNLEYLKVQKEKLLASLKKKKLTEEKRLAELEKAIKEMEALITRLEKEQERKRKEEHVVAKSPTGKYPWPVKGRVVMEYGTIVNPKYGTKIFNPGVDIEAAPGSSVLAIDDGVVIFAGTVTGYGNTVIIDHGGFFSVYSYLHRMNVSTGSRIVRGQVIGSVGTSDHYFGSRLHFEIRDRGKAVNPLLYLD